jgi:hypothetical protein
MDDTNTSIVEATKKIFDILELVSKNTSYMQKLKFQKFLKTRGTSVETNAWLSKIKDNPFDTTPDKNFSKNDHQIHIF